MSDAIRPIVMPKWGLAMQEGMVAKWLVEADAEIKTGDEILDIETSKIANVFESPVAVDRLLRTSDLLGALALPPAGFAAATGAFAIVCHPPCKVSREY